MKEMYIDDKDLNMYRIQPAPPKWDLQEYIATYLKEQDERYLSWFLHYYEKTLNKNVQSYMRQFFMQEHFADLKQAYIAGLLKALTKYTPDGGTPFVSFKEYYVEREIFDYIRSMRTGFTVQSLAEYAKLRKAMAVWDKYDRSYADTAIEAVAVELGETADDTKEILLGGLLNENRIDLYQQYAEDDEEAHPDTSSDTYTLYMKGELYARLWDAYDKLEYTERMMLDQRLGFCFDCHSTFYMDYDDLDEYGDPKKKPIKPMMYTDIATDHEYSSANTAHKKCEKALAKLKEAIKDLI